MKSTSYLPVSDEEAEVKRVDWIPTTKRVPNDSCGFITYLSILLISLSTNVLLLLHHPPKTCPKDLGKTQYSRIT
jgi:hypothetical protein